MDRHELNRMFDGLAPDPRRERELLRQLLQDDMRRKRPMKNWKQVVIGAAAAALLVTGATAAYDHYVRQDMAVEPSQTIQGMFGDSRPAWTERVEYDEYGNMGYTPNREIVPVDAALAQALVGDYLPETGYRWQIGDYTLTVEGYLLDEHTGTAKFYYTVEHPGGFGDGAVDWDLGLLNYNNYRLSIVFETQSDLDSNWQTGGWITGREYVDVGRSTPEKLCIVESAASDGGWKAEDGLRISFTVHGETDRDDNELTALLELPGVKSLPAVSADDPATGEAALKLSASALMLNAVDIDRVGCIVLDYADGTQYVVKDKANGLDNTDYVCGWGDAPVWTVRYCFNRLVDPSQVAAVIVDGHRYEVTQ